ncbi:uncharacterized protein LOC129590573 [Paramacrobiotus metropolitanus]|uniref:uncharacterized protein LOC129590573 n=1 Tax=Paramacrobiotus metropolitanus TaxID=2943436 RepID=UPI002445FD0F|nr:uncharacterized protein LOC129590573 [Paramacrobiotus metropolitanus]
MSDNLTSASGSSLPCFFHDLPEESIVHIFSFLDVIDLTNCTVVCKRWADITGDERLQKTVIFDLVKWENHYPLSLLPHPARSDTDARQEADQVAKEWRRQLLQRFWTTKTRRVVFRRLPGAGAPTECWIKIALEVEGEGAVNAASWR